jgi:RNA polymerase sigma factor (sigma-70 family)
MAAPPDSSVAASVAASAATSGATDVAEDSDEALMLSYAAGRAAAFDTLYARHKGGVYRYLLRHCGNAGIADELFQDVWMNAIRARDRYAPTAKFTTWLYTLAHHRFIDHWRASGQVKLASIDDDNDEGTRAAVDALPASRREEPEARVATRQLREQLHAALATLPSAQRDAFLLQHEAGLSLAEIGELTGVGIETVKSRLRYAVAKLRGELSPLSNALREELP